LEVTLARAVFKGLIHLRGRPGTDAYYYINNIFFFCKNLFDCLSKYLPWLKYILLYLNFLYGYDMAIWRHLLILLINDNYSLKRSFLWDDAGWPGKKRSWRNTIVYNILNSYFSQNTQYLFHHTDWSSNAIIFLKTDLSSLLSLLEISQSTFPNSITLNIYKFSLNILKFRNFQTLIIRDLNQKS